MNKLFVTLLLVAISLLKANLIYDTFDSPTNFILGSNFDKSNPVNSRLAYKISFSKFYNLENVNHIDIDKIQFKMKSVKFQEIFDYKYFRRGDVGDSPASLSFDDKNIKIDRSIFKLSFYKDLENKLSNILLFDLAIEDIDYNLENEVLTVLLNKKISLENRDYWLVFNFDSSIQKNLYFFGVNNLSGFNNLLFSNPGLKFKTNEKFSDLEYNNLNTRFYGSVKFKDMSKFDFKTKIEVFKDYSLLSVNLENDNNIKVELFDYKGMFVKTLFENQISKGVSYFFVGNKDLPEYEYFFKVSLDDENFVKSFKVNQKESKEVASFKEKSVEENPSIPPELTVVANPSIRSELTEKKIDYKFLFPGLYQFKTSKTKSFLLAISFSTSFVFSFVNLSNHYDTIDSYDNLLINYHQNPDPSTRDELQTLLNDADSYYNKFAIFSIASVLIYSYNAFDYFYFDYYNVKATPTTNLKDKSIGLQLNFNF